MGVGKVDHRPPKPWSSKPKPQTAKLPRQSRFGFVLGLLHLHAREVWSESSGLGFRDSGCRVLGSRGVFKVYRDSGGTQ